MTKKINWGIIGLGQIAERFAEDIQRSENAILHAVASREQMKAKQFSQRFHTEKYYGSYEELAKDDAIDVVYVATPHTFHYENTMMCLQHGKSVLCEKPMGMNTREVQSMFKEAASRKLFIMEGMWTRFIPATVKLFELLGSKTIGDILFLHADFGFKAKFDPMGRIFNKNLGGGSLLDIGIYPIYLSLEVLGSPSEIKAIARMSETSVDSYCAMLFDYKNEASAMLESNFEADTPIEAIIYGNKGSIKIHSRWHHSEKITLQKNGEEKEVFDLPYAGNGYIYEIDEVNQCLLNKATFSKKLPPGLSLDLIRIIDHVKDIIGLHYEADMD
ncbi:MAG: Gfo/Idh/MocA family oxidoreductase [Bacteroidales bacterium]|nr:Gfo/Idh/MocA family oxidoreductase [Bacteroidales bacterium]MCF8402707.1 Gfo/Idh/MocA family oxidoreductase [Bacteroidales bacterium]